MTTSNSTIAVGVQVRIINPRAPHFNEVGEVTDVHHYDANDFSLIAAFIDGAHRRYGPGEVEIVPAAPGRRIEYNAADRDYSAYLDDQYVGSYRSYAAAETELDRLAFEQLSQAADDQATRDELQSETVLEALGKIDQALNDIRAALDGARGDLIGCGVAWQMAVAAHAQLGLELGRAGIVGGATGRAAAQLLGAWAA